MSANSQKVFAQTIRALKKEDVIPDVVAEFTPLTTLSIDYGHYNNALLGNRLTTDPDAPSRKFPKYREYCHWIVSNIPAPTIGQPLDLTKGQVLMPYMGPAPPPGTDLHRYVFLLYLQPSDPTPLMTETLYTRLEKRHRFKARDFAARAGLVLIGANYFQAENTQPPTSRL
ncbi:hypothetical protein BGZ94_007330 [Podila epigama]|nr:hypothetical protein BGZ94_007330 [Podila epigama]